MKQDHPSTSAVAMIYLTLGLVGGVLAERHFNKPEPTSAVSVVERSKHGCALVNAVGERLSHSLMQQHSVFGAWYVECNYGP